MFRCLRGEARKSCCSSLENETRSFTFSPSDEYQMNNLDASEMHITLTAKKATLIEKFVGNRRGKKQNENKVSGDATFCFSPAVCWHKTFQSSLSISFAFQFSGSEFFLFEFRLKNYKKKGPTDGKWTLNHLWIGQRRHGNNPVLISFLHEHLAFIKKRFYSSICLLHPHEFSHSTNRKLFE